MKFKKYYPNEQLRTFIKYFVVSENALESQYKVFPSSSLVIGFQYSGSLASLQDNTLSPLKSAGITGLSNHYKVFKYSHHIGSILVYFTEIGFSHFSSHPAHELYSLSLSLDDVFPKSTIDRVEEQLALASNDLQRIQRVEQFFVVDFDTFQAELKAHQQGKTDYLTFIHMCAKTGIEKWKINIDEMTCTYYDQAGNEILVELIPE